MTDQTEAASRSAVTSQLAAWCAGLSLEQVPEPVQEAARMLTLDGLGCGLFGSQTTWGRILGDFVRDSGAGREATVWGSGRSSHGPHLASVVQAPLANGTFVHGFEFDDLHPVAALHGAAQVVPAALAISELRLHASTGADRFPEVPRKRPDNAEILGAIVAGLEVGARVGLLTGSEQLARGFHPSPNTGTISAAVTAGRLLHLDTPALTQAMGIAGSMGGSLMAAQYGAMVKRVHPGRSSQAGVTAALLAARGLTGISNVLEAPYGGFVHAYAGIDASRSEQILSELGRDWEIPNFSVKAYPCCGSNHTAIDAYASILEEDGDLGPGDIEGIDVDCSTLTYEHVGWTYEGGGVTSAQMNLSYTLAAMIIDRVLFVDQFMPHRVNAPDITQLLPRIHITPSRAIDDLGRSGRHAVRLSVRTRDGRHYLREVQHARGSATHPLSKREIEEKFRRQASRVLLPDDVATVERAAGRLGRPGVEDLPLLTNALTATRDARSSS